MFCHARLSSDAVIIWKGASSLMSYIMIGRQRAFESYPNETCRDRAILLSNYLEKKTNDDRASVREVHVHVYPKGRLHFAMETSSRVRIPPPIQTLDSKHYLKIDVFHSTLFRECIPQMYFSQKSR